MANLRLMHLSMMERVDFLRLMSEVQTLGSYRIVFKTNYS